MNRKRFASFGSTTCSQGKRVLEYFRLMFLCCAIVLMLSSLSLSAHTGKYHPEDYRDIQLPDPYCDTISVVYAEGQGSTVVTVEVEHCVEWVYDGSDPYNAFHQHARIHECGSRKALKIDVEVAKRALAAEKAIAYATYAIRAESTLGTLISELIACGTESLVENVEGCSDDAWAAFNRKSIELVDTLVNQQAEAIVTCNTLIEVAISEHQGCDLN